MEIEQGAIFDHDFGPRQNHLQEGPRPVVVIQSDALNRVENYSNVIVVPLTTRERKAATYASIAPSRENGLDRPSWAICNQIFTIDRSELKAKRGKLQPADFFAIKEGLRIALSL